MPVVSRISDASLRASVVQVADGVAALWDAGPNIRDYTDHGPPHAKRVLRYADRILECNRRQPWTDIELYLIGVGAVAHDMGMQVDALKRPDVMDEARALGAVFRAEFTATVPSEYSRAEQDAIRRNHHLISAAWLRVAATAPPSTRLDHAIALMPTGLVGELADIIAHHSQSDIRTCQETFLHRGQQRKLLCAAVLRLADEMDIGRDRVQIDTVKEQALPVEHAVWWWLHHATEVDLRTDGPGLLRLEVSLQEADHLELASQASELVVSGFRRKNAAVIDALCMRGVILRVDAESSAVQKLVERLPDEIAAEVRRMAEAQTMQTLEEALCAPPAAVPPLPFRAHLNDASRLADTLAKVSDVIGLSLLVEMSPRKVRDIAFREDVLTVFSLESIADQLKSPDIADHMLTIIRQDDQRDIFVLPEGPEMTRAYEVWDEQMDVVAIDVAFTVEARGLWDPKRRGLHQSLHAQPLFEADALPDGIREASGSMGPRTQLIVRMPVPEDGCGDALPEALERLAPWLRTLTLGGHLGLTLVDGTVNPVYRRYPSPWFGAAEARVEEFQTSRGRPAFRAITGSPGTWPLVDRLNAALAAASVAHGIWTLWRALREEAREILPPLLDKQRGRKVSRYLRQTLGEVDGETAISALGRAMAVPFASWLGEALVGARKDLDAERAAERAEELGKLVDGLDWGPGTSDVQRRAFDDLVAVTLYVIHQRLTR